MIHRISEDIMTKLLSSLPVVAMLAATLPLCGQGTANTTEQGNKRPGRVVLNVLPVNAGQSLNQLVDGSPLIVDGTVLSTLPPVLFETGGRRPDVETHSIVSINAVLKGAVPKNGRAIMVGQMGGQANGWDVIVEGDELLEQGSRYILFLSSDERTTPENTSGLTRYGIVSIWSGKVKVKDQKVSFQGKALEGGSLSKHQGSDVSEFVRSIENRVSGKYIPGEHDPTLPIHPSVPKK